MYVDEKSGASLGRTTLSEKENHRSVVHGPPLLHGDGVSIVDGYGH